MSQEETNDWVRQETADFVTGTAADIASSTDPSLGKRLDMLHLYLKGAFVLGSINKIDNQDWPDNVKTAIKMLVLAQTLGPVLVPSNLEMTFEEAWDAVHNLPEQHQGSLEYLTENFPNTFGEGPGGTLLIPEFLNWPGPGPYPGSIPPPGNPNSAPTPTPASTPVSNVIGPLGAGVNAASPIVLDIDGSGTIELAALDGGGSVYWDIDQDGFAEASGWITGGDGLLCIDLNSDGVISDHGELFGGTNGYVTLAAYDTNSSNTITSADAGFSDLLVWVDSNSDGYSQAGELHTLSSFGITSIATSYSTVNYAIAGNEIKFESTFVMNGNTYTSVDAFFNYDNVNTEYVGAYTLDARTLLLPTLRGYGNLPDLYIAMSLDENLLDLVQDFSELPAQDILSEVFSMGQGEVSDILFKWAGVDGVNPTSRGQHIDARVLEFLEEFMGEEYLQNGAHSNPQGTNPASFLNEAFINARDAFAMRLAYQALGAKNLFTEGASYNPVTDSFENGTALDLGAIDALMDAATGWMEQFNTAKFLVRVIEDVIGISNLPSQDFDDLQALMPAGVSIETILNTLTGSGTINGTASHDIIEGKALADIINGNDGNDIITGGAGNDWIYGGVGNDTYVFSAGADGDYITEYTGGGTDIVHLGGFATTDVRLATNNSGSLFIINKADASDQADLRGGVTGAAGTTYEIDIANYIEQIAFSDATWNLADGLTLEASSTGENLYGSQYNDTIHGMDGGDILRGNRGNDTITGGAGTDWIYGGAGNDTYVFGAGADSDIITEYAGEGTDIVRVSGLATTDVRLATNNSGTLFIINKADPTDQAELRAAVTGAAGTRNETDIANYIEQIVFDDLTTWNLADGLTLEGDSTGESLYGSQYNDTIHGKDGGDDLRGNRGNDTITGGAGTDWIYGGAGNDTYVFGAGADSDIITEYAGEGTDIVRVSGLATTDLPPFITPKLRKLVPVSAGPGCDSW